MDQEKLQRLLRLGIEKGASDIHLQVGYLPLYRFHGELVELRYKVLTPADTEAIARMLIEGSSRIGPLDELRDRKSTRLNSSHSQQSRMPSSA